MAKRYKNAPQEQVAVPENATQALEYGRMVKLRLFEIQLEEEQLANAKRELEEITEKKLEPLRTSLLTHAQALETYAENNREELTEHGKRKTFALGLSGSIRWYDTPGKVVFRKVEAVLEYLTNNKMRKFIRVKREPDKEAMLKDAEKARTIPGVRIVKGEKFVFQPTESKVRIEREPDGSWAIVTKDKEVLEE